MREDEKRKRLLEQAEYVREEIAGDLEEIGVDAPTSDDELATAITHVRTRADRLEELHQKLQAIAEEIRTVHIPGGSEGMFGELV